MKYETTLTMTQEFVEQEPDRVQQIITQWDRRNMVVASRRGVIQSASLTGLGYQPDDAEYRWVWEAEIDPRGEQPVTDALPTRWVKR